MKKYCIFALVFVLTGALLMGCGCTNQDMETMPAPTVLPTNEEVHPTTRETTVPTTAPTTVPTQPSETIDRGNGPLEDPTTDSTGATAEETGPARTMPYGNGSAGHAPSR